MRDLTRFSWHPADLSYGKAKGLLSWVRLCAFLFLVSACCSFSLTASAAVELPNLVLNGHFDDKTDPLNHWIYVFDDNKHYMKNHTYVSVVEDKASMRPHVLRLDVTDHNVCINQGVKIYTEPIRYDPKMKYKISLSARSIGTQGGPGPKCRIYPIAFRWHPKAQKSNTPSFSDIREDARFQVIYFDNTVETGPFSFVPSKWKRAESVIPTPGRTELYQSHLENCNWLCLKICALDATGVDKCNTGYLYVDDVKVEEIGPADEVKITSGAATKGFDGKSWNNGTKEQKKFVPIGGPKPSKKN